MLIQERQGWSARPFLWRLGYSGHGISGSPYSDDVAGSLPKIFSDWKKRRRPSARPFAALEKENRLTPGL